MQEKKNKILRVQCWMKDKNYDNSIILYIKN